MASRLDIQYGERVIDKKKVSVYTQGTAFDFSDCTFHAREAPEVLQVVEWHPKTGDTPTTCLVSVYKEQEGKLIFRRKEEMTDIGLLKILICAAIKKGPFLGPFFIQGGDGVALLQAMTPHLLFLYRVHYIY